ncbi:hypothetical protein [Falsiroseomonas selenitidurans]|uniref:Uncharacterized protein n=1 Tax=Falsiroseomonas selenitidurans TaxID=2716335 RepID=A0ABX1E8X0_9PROT|nr:hypothetical protein [Falsiroseomonas selenitidurans]NKC33336.1 hypothetical protein [Falsiroseomonas selenitidurans]
MSISLRKMFVRDVAIAGVLLGGMTGALIGLSESPVAGVAVTATLALAGALAGSAAASNRLLFMRWRIFVLFVTPFVLGLLPSMAGGLVWRSTQPSPGEQLIASLRGLGMNNREIADQLGKAAAAGGGAAVIFPPLSPLRSASGTAGAETPSATVSIPQCSNSLLRPPAGQTLLSDPVFIERFDRQPGRFADMAAWVRRQPLPPNMQESTFRLALLSAARFGACGS